MPFVGIRHFETRKGVSGNGTPYWVVQIKNNRDVVFYYEEIDHESDGDSLIAEKYYAGKYQKYMKCDFKQCDDFPRYFAITKDSIYEVNANCNRLYLSDCCDWGDNSYSKCPCEGDLNKEEAAYNIVNRINSRR